MSLNYWLYDFYEIHYFINNLSKIKEAFLYNDSTSHKIKHIVNHQDSIYYIWHQSLLNLKLNYLYHYTSLNIYLNHNDLYNILSHCMSH